MYNIILRPVEDRDGPFLREWISDKELTRYGDGDMDSNRPYLIFIAELKGRPIGGCAIFDIDFEKRRAEIGCWIADPLLRGKGYGAAVLQKMLPSAAASLVLKEIYARIHKEHQASIKLAEHLGFKRTNESNELITLTWRGVV